ncbi:MAG: hypothetical protein JHC33_06155 [Ignisphaera sp.]|nr:hypothetical protein [Ignisphaera sp.]
MKRYIIALGKHRGKLYTNSGDTREFRVSDQSSTDGTILNLKFKHSTYNWVELSDGYYYPLDLLAPIRTKTNIILEGLQDAL